MQVSDAVQDYAKAIYALERRGGGEPVLTNDLAGRLGVTAASASNMAKKLADLGLVEHLGVPWDRVHDEAEALEHVLSEDLEARIAAKLGHPTHDPHGDPIPSADLAIDEQATRSLDSLDAGATGRFVRVSDSDPAMLRYLDERGIGIGDELEVLDRQPFEGPLTVRFGDDLHVLGGALARAMRVDPAA